MPTHIDVCHFKRIYTNQQYNLQRKLYIVYNYHQNYVYQCYSHHTHTHIKFYKRNEIILREG